VSRLALGAVVAAGLAVGACGPTTADDTIDATPDDTIESGVIVDPTTPTTTEVVVGSASDLLPEISTDMSRLGAEIGGDGDEDATIARIELMWASVRDEVTATHPELVNGIGAAVEMARVGVDTNRPADADKAFSLLTDLIDRYFGDG
jgi:hypothetical protein